MSILRSAFLCVLAFCFLTPSVSLAQDAEEPLPRVETKAPQQSVKPLLFSVACLSIVLAFAAALAIALTFAYKSNRISSSTVCFIVGAVLVTSPVFGMVASLAGQFVAVATMPVDEGPMRPGALANLYWAMLPLTVFMYASFLAVPFGIVAIVAAFYFKKPTSESPASEPADTATGSLERSASR